MADWTDDLLPASLDGVRFLYREVASTVGRRKIVHQFPGRDEPYNEDMGREARRFDISAFVIGDTYMRERDVLRDMIEKKDGTFTFVHPYWGDMRVQILEPARFIERDDRGRYCEISPLVLGEAGSFEPRVALNTKTAVRASAAAVQVAVATKTRFSLLGAINAVLSSVTKGINAASAQIRKVNGKISAQMHLINNITQALNEFESQINTLRNTPTMLMNNLGLLVDSLMRLIADAPQPTVRPDTIGALPDAVAVAMEAFRDIATFVYEETVIPTPTPQSVIETTALADLAYTMKASALASTSGILPDLEFVSANDAAAVLTELATVADELMAVEGIDDEIVDSVSALKTELVKHLTLSVQQLPRLTTFTAPSTLPALVIAWEVHEDATRDLEIADRNHIPHPGYVHGSVPLEILGDA